MSWRLNRLPSEKTKLDRSDGRVRRSCRSCSTFCFWTLLAWAGPQPGAKSLSVLAVHSARRTQAVATRRRDAACSRATHMGPQSRPRLRRLDAIRPAHDALEFQRLRSVIERVPSESVTLQLIMAGLGYGTQRSMSTLSMPSPCLVAPVSDLDLVWGMSFSSVTLYVVVVTARNSSASQCRQEYRALPSQRCESSVRAPSCGVQKQPESSLRPLSSPLSHPSFGATTSSHIHRADIDHHGLVQRRQPAGPDRASAGSYRAH